MKIKIQLKSPDAVLHAVSEAVQQGMPDDLEPFEYRCILEERMDNLFEGPLKKWIGYREYVTIEIDTDTGTAKVLEQG
jgi:hypothetical protein